MEIIERNSEDTFQLSKGYRPFMLVVLFFSLYLAYLVLRPFLHTIIFAIILASISYPMKAPLLRLYRGRETPVALTAVAIITFLIIITVVFFMSALLSQGIESINRISQWISEGNLQKLLESPQIVSYITWIRERLAFLKPAEADLSGYLLQLSKSLGQFILGRGAGVLKDAASMVFHFFIMIFVTFYLVRDGKEMLAGIKYLSPLREDQEDRIIARVKAVGRSALLGSFLTALCQGVVGGIGLAIVGIPGLFWGSLMGFSSLIPVVGTALIWIPAVGYLTILGKWKAAVFLFLWCIFLVGSIDNFLRPFLMRGEGKMSPFYIFLSIIGGVKIFGLAGILYGPLILGFANVMLYIYRVEYQESRREEKSAHASRNS